MLNPQGLEEFGATDPGRARLKRAAYLPLRRAVLACARAADRVIATDRALEPVVRQHLHVPAERVRVIPERARPALRSTGSRRPPTRRACACAAGIGRDESCC